MTGEIARIYDARASIPYDPDSDTAYINDDVALVEAVSGVCARLLDAGCGLGWHIDKFVDRGFGFVAGVDVSAAAIDAGRRRLGAKTRTGWELFCGDLRAHHPPAPYDVVASFLSCVGWFGEEGDEALLRCLRGLLRPGAPFIMTSFYLEGADALIGEFETTYAGAAEVTLQTHAAFDATRREIVFDQRIRRDSTGDVREIETERIRLYSRAEMRGLLLRAGFASAETYAECKLGGVERTVDRSGVMLSVAYA